MTDLAKQVREDDLTIPAMLDRTGLPGMLNRAATYLTSATTAAQVLEAREMYAGTYDAGKRAARLAKAKKAHDEVLASIHRAQADALDGEARAKRILADEYDAAQERGEVAKAGDNQHNKQVVPGGNDLGISRKDIHEAREIRNAESESPGIVRRALDAMVARGEEPTRAEIKRAVKAKSKRTRGPRIVHAATTESQHDRDLKMLLGVWEAACQSARDAFLETVVN